MQQEPVTVAILNYNGKQEIGDAIRSANESSYHPTEILVIDDGSTDGSIPFIKGHFPFVRVVSMGENTGMLNKVRNRALGEARTRLVLLMDHDVVLDPCCVSALVSHMHSLSGAAVLTTSAFYYHDPERIYVGLQKIHYLCNTVAIERDGILSDRNAQPKPSWGWGTMLIDKIKAQTIGYFDEDYRMGWGDDGEFHHKIHLIGLGCYNVPEAVVYHKRHIGADRIYGSIHNRWYLIFETYALKTLVLLAPALLLYEISLLALLSIRGQSRHYIRAFRDLLTNFPHLITKRSSIQRLRVKSDRELLVGGPIYVREEYLGRGFFNLCMGVLNNLFEGYWKIVHRLL
jgi:GT2 family glycosyltransferase